MNKIIRTILITLVITFLTNCSNVTQFQRLDITPPVFNKYKWESSEYNSYQNDRRRCVADAGHNAVKIVVLESGASGTIETFVESTRRLKPGTIFSISTDSNVYRTMYPYFTPQKSKTIIANLMNGETAYLRWSEPNGKRKGRHILTNIVKSDRLKKNYIDCLNTLKRQT